VVVTPRTRFSDGDLEHRRPVWEAMSEIFLDTELVESDFDRIVPPIAASPYSLEELDDILWWEVYPVLYTNMLGIAGEWTGFNIDWLESRIKEGPSRFTRLWTRTLGRKIVTWPDWKIIRRRVAAARHP
jgi:hypothetical protein